jgi:hypothetical protein
MAIPNVLAKSEHQESLRGYLEFRPLQPGEKPPDIPSEYDDWGPDFNVAQVNKESEYYVVHLVQEGSDVAVAFVDAFPSYLYGPTTGSKAMMIGTWTVLNVHDLFLSSQTVGVHLRI